MANDRDCENCIHKVNGACNVWECKFEPERGMTKEEAIEIIECGEISNRWGKDGEEVEKMAIEALQQEPKTGHWIDHEKHIECDSCSVWFLKNHLIRKSFCPNCGAKMSEMPTGSEGSEQE